MSDLACETRVGINLVIPDSGRIKLVLLTRVRIKLVKSDSGKHKNYVYI